ncbi:MAG: DUF1343 domain-containing protein, partial [Deltaproteobacteria bacterium]|nr:DUF1343 domain-containing protein [Deltaproteobacteria bacterium]
CRSFVGLFPLPLRHGLTIGEVARWLVLGGLDCQVEVTAMAGYEPRGYFDSTGLPWVMPSPNMPSLDTALVYPGQVLFEGTNLSEGRGTTRPFEIFGAPFIDPFGLAQRMAAFDLDGVVFRPIYFEPTFHKFSGQLCGGLFLHVVDRAAFKPYKTSLALLQAVFQLWPDQTVFKGPPYEYEYERRPIDLILGRQGLADQVAQGRDLGLLTAEWAGELAQFSEACVDCHLY